MSRTWTLAGAASLALGAAPLLADTPRGIVVLKSGQPAPSPDIRGAGDRPSAAAPAFGKPAGPSAIVVLGSARPSQPDAPAPRTKNGKS